MMISTTTTSIDNLVYLSLSGLHFQILRDSVGTGVYFLTYEVVRNIGSDMIEDNITTDLSLWE